MILGIVIQTRRAVALDVGVVSASYPGVRATAARGAPREDGNGGVVSPRLCAAVNHDAAGGKGGGFRGVGWRIVEVRAKGLGRFEEGGVARGSLQDWGDGEGGEYMEEGER